MQSAEAETPTMAKGATGSSGESSYGLFDVAIALGREKWSILIFDMCLTLSAVLVSLFIPASYTARTLLLPPQQGQASAGSALATLGVLSAGLGGLASSKTPEELYVSLLKSDSITDNLIYRFKLQERYREKTITDARKVLARRVAINADRKSGLIRVEVDDRDPAFAADLANSYADELRGLMNRIAVTEASQRRLFFVQQADIAKEAFAKAELNFKAAQEKYGIQSIDARAQGDIRAAAELRAQVMARKVQVQAMQQFAGPENADVQRLVAEIGSLRSQLGKVEHGAGTDSPSSEAALANQRAYREVKYQEAILSGLITQAEIARGDEARQAPLVQQVDVARPPDLKSSPKRALIALAMATGGLLLGCGFALVRQSWASSRQVPLVASKWLELKQVWLFRRQTQ